MLSSFVTFFTIFYLLLYDINKDNPTVLNRYLLLLEYNPSIEDIF